ncbi:MAG: hypothetical protein RSD04_04670, partial [Clostridia bacterium]
MKNKKQVDGFDQEINNSLGEKKQENSNDKATVDTAQFGNQNIENLTAQDIASKENEAQEKTPQEKMEIALQAESESQQQEGEKKSENVIINLSRK